MSKISAEAKVGVFVVIGMIILGYMSMKVGKFTFGRAAGYDVKVYFDSVSGLAEDVQVEVAGVEVGRVRKISLEKGKALVVLKINSDVMLTKDVKAVIRTKGILGDKYVELIQGSSAAPLIQDGGTRWRQDCLYGSDYGYGCFGKHFGRSSNEY
ncbi:MAG: MCE family protein [Deltaproteobacteria bacterium]|nr:MCE family protein [Deltaproteobacteria bacterium]